MATIKRNGDKVVIKDGKVSCSCCEFECCMYSPRLWYEQILTEEDFPDQVTFEYSFSLGPSGYGPITLTRGIQDENIVYTEGAEPNTYLVSINNPASWASGDEGSALVGGICLNYDTEQFIDGELVYVEKCRDFFANAYNISGPISGVVNRTTRFVLAVDTPSQITKSYCGEWLGTNLVLIFNGAIGKWTVNGNAKSGLQNTPVGSYAGGFTVS